MEFNYRDNLPDEIKNWAYVTNLGENANIGTHWIALYSSNNKITYFDNFGAKHMSKEIKEFIKGSTITTNSFYNRSICFNNAWILLELLELFYA